MSTGFHQELGDFILQAHTQNLKVTRYSKTSGDFKVAVSFGKGGKSKVPWISFLAPEVSTSNGYYPVYLYYMELGKLVLAFGISEETEWLETWPSQVTNSRRRIGEEFGIDGGFRFLDSWVFRTYEVNVQGDEAFFFADDHDVSGQDLDSDLHEILEIYQSCLPKPEEAIIIPKRTASRKNTKEEEIVFRPSPEIKDLIGSDGPNNTVSVAEAIKKYRLISVKDYQRSYQWSIPQLDELFADLFDAVDSGESHFFGTLIIQNDEDSPNGTIVDGQQRLTSIFLLVSALRDEIHNLDRTEIAASDAELMPINVLSEVNAFLFSTNKFSDQRFQSNRGIRPILRDSVISPPKIGDRTRKDLPTTPETRTQGFLRAAKHVRQEVVDDLKFYESSEDKLKRIYLLFRGVSEQFKVLRLVTNDLSESLEIFLTLNNRGLPLGPSDIVRGEIMGVLSKNLGEKEADELQSKVLTEWELVADLVEEPETFLRHYLVATSDEKIQKKKIVGKVTEKFKSKTLSVKEQKVLASNFWNDLQKAANHYGVAVNPSLTNHESYLLSLLEHLSKSHRIMVLGILSSNLPTEKVNELIRLTFVLSFRWVIANQNAQRLEDFYQKRCEELRQEKSADLVIQTFKAKATELNLRPIEFLSLEGDSSAITRVLLHAIHVYLHPKQEITALDNKRFHLEHIAPKTSTEHWRKKLAATASSGRTYDLLVQQAGNLLLLDQKLNIEAQQKPFIQKRDDHYKSATFFSHTNDLSQLVEWNGELISKRTKWLAEMFEVIWSVEETEPQVVSFQDWLTRNK